MSLHEFVAQYPDCVGLELPNGRKITNDDPNNEMLTICFTCISQYSDVPDESLEDKNESADEEIEGSVGSFSCYGEEDMTGTSILDPNYIPPLRLPGKSCHRSTPGGALQNYRAAHNFCLLKEKTNYEFKIRDRCTSSNSKSEIVVRVRSKEIRCRCTSS